MAARAERIELRSMPPGAASGAALILEERIGRLLLRGKATYGDLPFAR